MKINNLKINNKKLISLGMSLILAGSLVGCGKTNDGKDTYSSDSGLVSTDSVVSSGKIIGVNRIKLFDKDGKEVTSLDVIVDGKIMHISNPVDAKLDSNISQVVYNNQIVSIDEFKLKDIITGMEISTTEYRISNGELVEYNISSKNVTKFSLTESRKTISSFEQKLCVRGISYTHEEVVRTYILLNIDALTTSFNKEVLDALMEECGAKSITDLYGDVTEYDDNGKVSHSADKTKIGYGELSNNIVSEYNYPRFYQNGMAFGDVFDLGDLIEDETQREIYTEAKKELVKMSFNSDTYVLDASLVKFVDDFQNRNGIYENMTVGTEYALSPLFAEFRGMVFMVCHEDDRALTPESKGAIGYIAPYSEVEYMYSFNADMFENAKELFANDDNTKTLAR